MAVFSLRYRGGSLRKNVLYAQPESGRRGWDWFLDESSLLTDPFIHIVRLTKPGNSRTSNCLLHSRVWRNSWLHYCIIKFYFPCFCFCPRAWWPLFCSLPRNTFQKLWQSWRWSFGLEINGNCKAVVMKGFTQLRARQCWLQWTRHPPPLWFHSLFSRVLVAAVGLFSRNFDSWIWFLCLFQHQRWLYSHVHTICCFYWRILSLITLCKGCPVPLDEMRYADNACSSLFNDLYKFCLFSVISLVLAIEPPVFKEYLKAGILKIQKS